jgi:hypothetical protein
MEAKWQYQQVLEDNKVENKYDNFLRFLLQQMKKDRKGVRSIYDAISNDLHLDPLDCAIIYNTRGWGKHPTAVWCAPQLFSADETAPHLIMMAVLINLMINKDPEFESLIAKKTAEYLELFEKDRI